jgi:hypothetical protein
LVPIFEDAAETGEIATPHGSGVACLHADIGDSVKKQGLKILNTGGPLVGRTFLFSSFSAVPLFTGWNMSLFFLFNSQDATPHRIPFQCPPPAFGSANSVENT